MEYGWYSTMRVLPFDYLTNDIKHSKAKDFELVRCEQQKIIADQVMVYMELKTIVLIEYNLKIDIKFN